MGSENGLTRPPLDQWGTFSKALRDLLSAAGVNKLGLARKLQLDGRVVGAIVEGREPCPESFLIRLYERDHEGLGRSQHLSALVRAVEQHERLCARHTDPFDVARRSGPGDRCPRRRWGAARPANAPTFGPAPGGSKSAVDPGDTPATIEAEAAPGPRQRARRSVVITGLAASMLVAGVLLLNDRSTPGGNGAAQASMAPVVTRTIQIYNKVTKAGRRSATNWSRSSPASRRTIAAVTSYVFDGTEILSTGDTVTAVCQTLAARSTNGDDTTTADDQNPELLRIAALVWNSLARRTTRLLSRSLGPFR